MPVPGTSPETQTWTIASSICFTGDVSTGLVHENPAAMMTMRESRITCFTISHSISREEKIGFIITLKILNIGVTSIFIKFILVYMGCMEKGEAFERQFSSNR
jgi:hypothetical protein